MAALPRRIRAAFACNILGTTLLGASMFTDEPLVFMCVVALGVPLLAAGFALWLLTVVAEARGRGLFH